MLSNRVPETSTNLDQIIQITFKLFDEEKSTPNKSHRVDFNHNRRVGRGDNCSHDLEERSITSESPIPLRSVPLSIFQPDRESPLEEREPWTEEVVKGWRGDLTRPWSPAPVDRKTEPVVPWWKRRLSTAIRLCNHPDPSGYKCPI